MALMVQGYRSLHAIRLRARLSAYRHLPTGVFLSSVIADTPANRKLSKWLATASYLGCPYCWLKGTRGDNGGMYFKGYCSECETGSPHGVQNVPSRALCGDKNIKVSSEMQHARARTADEGKNTAIPPPRDKLYALTRVGSHGVSPFIKNLSYVDYNNDGGEEVFPKPELREAWNALRSGLLHYFRFQSGNFASARKEAQRNLFKYAQLVEQHMDYRLLTYNLHMLNCRLYDQETARGHVFSTMEFWVERMVQYMKSNVKFRTTAKPELLFVSDLLIDDRLAELRSTLVSIDGMFSSDGARGRNALQHDGNVRMDRADPVSKSQLLGYGRKCTVSENDDAEAQFLKLVHEPLNRLSDWVGAQDLQYEIFIYADKRGDEVLTSEYSVSA